MFKEGCKVKIKKSEYITDLASQEREGKTGVIEQIRFPFGLHVLYMIKLDGPIVNKWGMLTEVGCYDYENCLELL